MDASARYQPFPFGVTRGVLTQGPGGVQYLRAKASLQASAPRMTDRLVHWACTAPERPWIAQRARAPDGSTGDWKFLSYASALAQARNIAQALLRRGLDAQAPVWVMSENSTEHALLTLGCMLAGVPWCATSPAYATGGSNFDKLRHVAATLTPGLVFASSAACYEDAIDAVVPRGVEVVLCDGELTGRKSTPFGTLLATPATAQVDAAMAATHSASIVKFLFTSGSTGKPKAVVHSHGMWCTNQQQLRQSMPLLCDEPPVLVDWLPWSHTFGGNHNVGLVLYNGGTLYIDEGNPTPARLGETLRNLTEVSPTLYFSVPLGLDALARAMQTDLALRRSVFARLRMFFYAGATLAQSTWDSLDASAEAERGQRIVIASGLGMTESGPFSLFVTSPHAQAGDVGLPAAGLLLKLVPGGGKLELRYRGPNITPGYWRSPQETKASFDAEGYFCSGDAVRWIDPDNIHRGLRFDGRMGENFKLATGSFVMVDALRQKIIALAAGLVQDVVLSGPGRNDIGALVFVDLAACHALSGLPGDASRQKVLLSPPVTARFQRLANVLAQSAEGSATRVMRLCLLIEPASPERGEITDKGSVNQRAVLANRSALVEALHAGTLLHALTPVTGNIGDSRAALQKNTNLI
jgi:feruloyl-CoA synthase